MSLYKTLYDIAEEALSEFEDPEEIPLVWVNNRIEEVFGKVSDEDRLEMSSGIFAMAYNLFEERLYNNSMNKFTITEKRYFGDAETREFITSDETGELILAEVCDLLNEQTDKIAELQANINTLEIDLKEYRE